ncbi:DeoR/GlpR transcriptional regulator [Bacillaceae bacterium SIJ1]|uniref:DeoR/GlpR family DNA-binding transcription regulator n=1 Tax=Litoribacterium kuwaitense TaxID=1398745 RepID=UPI0013EA0CB7|nr:DeoR/GlpR family DNA-binding transcription regulator [Litoribacterium kuwaitense]NGP46534.1 DeoR/GlpR transcriptional regulator [Litoribacterium kuwaitense]
MLKGERQQQIVEIVQLEGKVTSAELSKRLDVSEDTIRRDLREMDENGWIKRVHGGAFPIHAGPLLFSDRNQAYSEEKMRLAKKGLELIKDGQVIIMDGSTTNLQLVKALPHTLHLTIITNSPVISLELAEHPHVKVILLGGNFLKASLVTIGSPVISALKQIKADLCFLGVYAIHHEFGISVPHYEESLVKQQMLESANQTAILLTQNKVNTVSHFFVGGLSDVDFLVIEKGAPALLEELYQEYDIEVVRA